ncbi:MAG: hypothetical protein IKK08_08435 [Clostridia bacterium]|nr:hypothetical protein [Clostridia bacterium]
MEPKTLDLCLFGEDGAAGEAAAEQPAAEAAQTTPGKEEAFNRLITGEYRDEYVKRTQQMIDARFKQSKELESRYNDLRPVLDRLAQRYGVDAAAKDLPRRLLAAMDQPGDEATAAQAEQPHGSEAGETPPQEAEQAQLHARMQDAARFMTRTQHRWQQEAQQLRTLYPDFDLAAEMNGPLGPRFVRLLRTGLPMKTAYQALHMDELVQGAIGYAVENTRQRTMDSIRARGMRPEEAAAGTQAAAAQILNADPAHWNAEEMNDAIRQARMGKKIYL